MAKKQTGQSRKQQKKSTALNKKWINITVVFVILAVAAYFIFANLFVEKKIESEYMFKKEGELIISDSTGNEKVKIDIEVADTDFDRQLGLMFRKEMEENQGMFFIFPVEQLQAFWMINTFLPLDIIFINSENKIVSIHKNTKPLSDQSYPSSEQSIYVLEVNAGFSDKYNVNAGDLIRIN